MSVKGKFTTISVFKRVAGELLIYKKELGIVVITIVTYTLTSVYSPYLLKEIIDKYIMAKDLHGLALMALFYFSLNLGAWISQVGRSYTIQKMGQSFLKDLRSKVFNKLQQLHVGFFTNRRIGDLISITINDTSMLNEVLVSGIFSVLGDMISLIGIIIMMCYLSPTLTLFSVLNLPIVAIIALKFGKKIREAYKETRLKIADATTVVEEGIAGISVVKAFNREEFIMRSFEKSSRETMRAYVKVAKIMGIFWPSMDFAEALATVFVLIYGGFLVIKGMATIGLVIAFLQYVNRMSGPIMQFIGMYDSLQAAIAAADRIYGIIDEKVEIKDPERPIELSEVLGEIKAENITFSYVPGVNVLKSVSFKVRPGEVIAIVGKTGAGKTTLTNLMLRFYDPKEGAIYLDGVDIRNLRIKDLRKVFGYVPQETYLFNGTIMDNIRLGREIPEERVIEVCKRLGIHEFIQRLPKGYYTDAGEAGKKLSTGEKQLISIARVMMKDPKIVILDEALSSVDPSTEETVRRAIWRLMEGRTGIIVAHRLSVAKDCDRIIVMDSGKIVEEGRHEELLRRKGVYYRLVKTLKEEIEAI